MRLAIDQFYLHPKHNVIKFVGYNPDGQLLFDRWARWGETPWSPQNRLTVNRIESAIKPIPPPE